MKKVLFITLAVLLLTSCGVQRKMVIPKALSTVNTAGFAELNLDREDYEILNTVTATAVVSSVHNGNIIKLQEENDEFTLRFVPNKFGSYDCNYSGVVRMGYLSNDYNYNPEDLFYADELARRLAIYRMINIAQQNGADGVIEPTISISVEQMGKAVMMKATVVAKIIKLKTDN